MGMSVRIVPIRNVAEQKLIVVVEPWADQYELRPDESLKVVFYGPDGEEPDIHIGDQLVSVYGWTESIAFVLKDNIEVDAQSLLEIIRASVEAHASVDREAVGGVLRTDLLEFMEAQLESAPAWDTAGHDAAILSASKLAPLLLEVVNDRSFVVNACQRVLQSRGVFWMPDQETVNHFFSLMVDDSSNVYVDLTQLICNSAQSMVVDGASNST